MNRPILSLSESKSLTIDDAFFTSSNCTFSDFPLREDVSPVPFEEGPRLYIDCSAVCTFPLPVSAVCDVIALHWEGSPSQGGVLFAT